MNATGGEVLPDVVWLERCVKRAQECPGITLPDVDLTRHACSSAALGGDREKEAPGAAAQGTSELDSLVTRVRRHSVDAL
jgi:hypothetical protein